MSLYHPTMSSDDLPANVLFEWYGRYIGDPDAETDVYLGFALFFGGIALGAVGVVVFLLSALGSGGQPLWALREVAVVAAAGGFPILLLGIVTLLPGDRRMLYVATGGIAVCLVALALFVYAYPWMWNVDGTDYSAQGVAIYAVGLVAIMGSTAAALVGHQVERAAGPAGGPEVTGAADGADGAGSESDAGEDPDAVSAQARRDVDEAMDGADISWGGVEKRETKRLQLNTPDMGEVSGNVDRSSAKTTRDSGSSVDDAVAAMQGLKGGNKETASGGGTDDQAAALRNLREKQQAEEMAEADGPVEKVKANGLVDGLRQYFGDK
jgi:hypothetical protein